MKTLNNAELALFQQEIHAFWEVLQTKWRREVYVFRQPFSRPIANTEEYFQLLVSWSDGVRDGKGLVNPRLLDEDLLPRQEHQTVENFCADMEKRCPRDWYLYVTDGVHQYQPSVWDRVAEVFRPALSLEKGIPSAGCTLDFFLGRYDRTPTGIHRDDAETLAFVTHGTKRLLFWPNEKFEAIAKWHTPEKSHYRTGIYHYERHLDDAIVVEAQPGDVIYWPRQFYHIGTSADHWSGMITLGMWWDANPQVAVKYILDSLFADTENTAAAEPYPYDPSQPASYVGQVPKELSQAARDAAQDIAGGLASATRHLWASLTTSYGFRETPGARDVDNFNPDFLQVRHPIASVEIDGVHHLYAAGNAIWESATGALGEALMQWPLGSVISLAQLHHSLAGCVDAESVAKLAKRLQISGALQAIDAPST